MKALQLGIYLCLLTPSCILADDLIGVVRSKSGRPLTGVFVYSRSKKQIIPREKENTNPFQTVTDKNGRFRLTEYGQVLFLRKKGYEPLVKKLNMLSSQLEIFLATEQPKKNLASCAKNEKPETLNLGNISLTIGAQNVIEKNKSADSLSFSVKGSGKTDNSILSIISGTTVSIGFPTEELILASKEYQINSVRVGEAVWVSARGSLSTGKRWRFLGNSTAVISYENVSNEVAILFDRIFNSMCINQH